jgi:hypothetical protein
MIGNFMGKRTSYVKQFISTEEIAAIRGFYEKMDPAPSGGPWKSSTVRLGHEGAWDRSLHLDKPGLNPGKMIVDRLQRRFGLFDVYTSSIRYLAAPFAPHSDVISAEWLLKKRATGLLPGWKFLIPLAWIDGYNPKTYIFSSPPEHNEKLYSEYQHDLPYTVNDLDGSDRSKNFSIKTILEWKDPGDLLAWQDFQWHCSSDPDGMKYNLTDWRSACKEFISVETMRKS